MIMGKRYIPVLLHVNENGKITPKTMKAGECGEWIKIDKVTDSCRKAILKVGGIGVRYTCVITRDDITSSVYLFEEDGKWFIITDDDK